MLATHEQVLGGDTGQVYIGCRFPADPAYVSELARHGEAIGASPVAVSSGGSAWTLRRPRTTAGMAHLRAGDQPSQGGTTHLYVVLSHLVPGSYRSRCRGVAGVRRHAAVVLGDRQPRRRVVARLAPVP